MGPLACMGIAVAGLASLCGVLAVALANARVERDAAVEERDAMRARLTESQGWVEVLVDDAEVAAKALRATHDRLCKCHGRHGV